MQRVGYLGLMLLLDETHETLMMVTNSLKTDLNRFGDPYIVLNALTALANICSAGMAADLAPEVERLADGRFLQRNGITGALSGHIRKKALLTACRMVTRAPDLEETFRDVPGTVIPDGNHAVVMAGAPPLVIPALPAPSIHHAFPALPRLQCTPHGTRKPHPLKQNHPNPLRSLPALSGDCHSVQMCTPRCEPDPGSQASGRSCGAVSSMGNVSWLHMNVMMQATPRRRRATTMCLSWCGWVNSTVTVPSAFPRIARGSEPGSISRASDQETVNPPD